ncbi:MAG TPA: hypothetical protein VF573_24050 [Paraburkholderia sp.]
MCDPISGSRLYDTTVDWAVIGDRNELDVRGAHPGPYCYPIMKPRGT